ncbi:MAG: NACHT domain-containing protein [Spirosomataceae bacterium]
MEPNPFKLFDSYNANEKEVFFGRDIEIQSLYHLLQQTRLVLIYGASGIGKTSLIQAGLPKVYNLTDWYGISVRRRDDINESLKNELNNQLKQLAESVDNNKATTVGDTINTIYKNRWIPVYLVFDQFEEIFTLGNHDERALFFTQLQQLLSEPFPCKILLSMREEYIGHLYEYEATLPALFDKRFRVEAMKDGTVQSVVQKMIQPYVDEQEKKGISTLIFERIKNKDTKEPVYLPYMQVYLYYLYKESKGYFTKESIEEVGLDNVLKQFIETIVKEAQSQFNEWRLPNTFAIDLLDEFATTEGTKQAGKVTELAERLSRKKQDVKKSLQYFTERKLLRADENDIERYEPVHDVVAKQIHELRSPENKDFKEFLRQLQNDYERWKGESKPETRLLTENDVARAEIYQGRLEKQPEFEAWQGYIEQSKIANEKKLENAKKEAEDKEKQNRKLQETLEIAQIAKANAETAEQKSKTNAKIAWWVAAAAVIVGIGAIWFFLDARKQQAAAEKARKEATANLLKFQETEINTYLQDADIFQKSGDRIEVKIALDSARSITERYFKATDKYDSLFREIKKRELKTAR